LPPHTSPSDLFDDVNAVEILGENIVSFSDIHASLYRRDTIAYVSQSFHLFEELTVKENLYAALVIKKLTLKEMEILIKKTLTQCNILHKENAKASTLSGGEKQRLVLARALASEATIILCDEPTSNLDKVNSLIVMKLLEELNSFGKTIIIATHDPLLDELQNITQTIYLKEGKIE